MLHLLPQPYVQELKKEYRQRCFVAACHLLSFCLLVFVLGLIPSLVLIRAEKDELQQRDAALAARISDQDRQTATTFEASVKKGIAVLRNPKVLSSKQIDYILSLPRVGVALNDVSVIREAGSEQAQLRGVANSRTNLTDFVNAINAGGQYIVDDVPASTFKKDRDIDFSLVLKKINSASQ